MHEYINPATWIIAILAVLTIMFYAVSWYNEVNHDRKSFTKFIDRIDQRLDRFEKGMDQRLDRFEKRMDQRIDRMDERMSKMDQRMDRMDERIFKMDERMSKMDGRISKMDLRMDNMSEILNQTNRVVRSLQIQDLSKTAESKSPRRLSELGHRVSQEINAPVIVEVLLPDVWPEAKDKSPYDVQAMCFDYIFDWKPTGEVESRIKDSAYQNGISWYETVEVIALQLRDRILERQSQEKKPSD